MQKQTTYQLLQPEDRITIATIKQRGFSVQAITQWNRRPTRNSIERAKVGVSTIN
jgi:hypothetical protein